MDKLVHPYNLLLNNKKECSTAYAVTWMSIKIIRQSKKSQTQRKREYVLYAFFYMTSWEKKNYRDKNRSFGEGRDR